MQVQPYLFFDGRCEEALDFYKKALGAKVEMLMRFKESPEQGHPMCSPGYEEKVMHSCFKVGDTSVMASDGYCEGKSGIQGLFALDLGEDRGRGRQDVQRARRRRSGADAADQDFFSPSSACAPTSSASAGW